MPRRVIVAALVVGCGLVVCDRASAQLPAAHPPPRHVAGMSVKWPGRTSVAPGQKVSVSVRSAGRRARISLTRVDAHGRAMRTIARRTLRTGTFTAAIPARAGARYALTLEVAGRRYWSWITTPARAQCGPDMSCGSVCGRLSGPRSSAVTVSPAAVQAGDPVRVAIRNTGAKCLVSPNQPFGACIEADGATTPVAGLCPQVEVPALQLVALPGETWSATYTIPPGTPPGTYRAVPAYGVAASAEFQVVP